MPVKLAPLTAGKVDGNLASGIIPDDKFDALVCKFDASPVKDVALHTPETSIPVAVVVNFALPECFNATLESLAIDIESFEFDVCCTFATFIVDIIFVCLFYVLRSRPRGV